MYGPRRMQQQSPSDRPSVAFDDERGDIDLRAALEATRLATAEPTAATDSADSRASGTPQSTDLDALAAEIHALRAAIDECSAQYSTTTTPSSTTEPDTSGFEWVDEPTDPPELRALTERVETLETHLAVVAEQVADQPLAELESAVDSQQAAYEELDDKLETELDDVETVLNALVDRTETLAERLDSISETQTANLEPLKERLATREALLSLTREALRHGITEAVCQHCEQSVDIELLERPRCPACERRFRDIQSGGWSPLSTPVLRTASRRPSSPAVDDLSTLSHE